MELVMPLSNDPSLTEWCIAVLPGLLALGLQPEIATMLEANARSNNKRAVRATALELAETIKELPPLQRAAVESMGSHIPTVSVGTLLAPSSLAFADILKRGVAKNRSDVRKLQDAISDGTLSDDESKIASSILGAYLLKSQKQGYSGSDSN